MVVEVAHNVNVLIAIELYTQKWLNQQTLYYIIILWYPRGSAFGTPVGAKIHKCSNPLYKMM